VITLLEEAPRPLTRVATQPAPPPFAPRRRLNSISFLAWAVRGAAVINFIAFTLHRAPPFIYWLAAWVPIEISVGRRVLMLLTSILLLVLASGLERGKKVAWLITLGALALAPLIHLGRMVIWPQLLLNLPLIGLLLINRRYFRAQSDEKSVWSALIVCPVLLILLMGAGTIKLHQLRFETSGSDSWAGSLQAACELILVQNAHAQAPQTPHAARFFSVLRISGTSIALLALFLSMQPVLYRPRATAQQIAKARRLMGRHGQDPEEAYALLGDKSLFFHSQGQAVISYAVARRFAIVLADPIGPRAAQEEAIAEFHQFCRYCDWVPLFYQASGDLLDAYQRNGFQVVKIGEDARLRADLLDLKGRDFQNLRTLCNNAAKKGVRFRWYAPGETPEKTLEKQLAAISAEWLRRKRGVEMTFDMGGFSIEEVRRLGAGVALSAEGEALAFTTWRPFARGTGRVLDLMRAAPEARNILDFVIVESMRHFRAQGVTNISLGNAPLANASTSGDDPAHENRLIRFIYENLNHVYAYKPLFQFKQKYRPQWRPRYLAYPRGESLPLIGVALVQAHAPKGGWKFLRG
jgi:phosphatidylglycerol lysyltransferase